MGLETVFINGVESIFKILEDAVKSAQYKVAVDNGWDDPSEETNDVRVIIDKLSQEDVEKTSFYDLIQPTDVVGLIPGNDLLLAMKASNTLQIADRTFTIVAFDTDAFEALFTVLLRDT